MSRTRTPRPALPEDVKHRLATFSIGGESSQTIIVNLLDALEAETIRATELEAKYHYTSYLVAQAELHRLRGNSDE